MNESASEGGFSPESGVFGGGFSDYEGLTHLNQPQEKSGQPPKDQEKSDQDPSHRGGGPPLNNEADQSQQTKDENGGPASEEKIRELQQLGVGSLAEQPPESRPAEQDESEQPPEPSTNTPDIPPPAAASAQSAPESPEPATETSQSDSPTSSTAEDKATPAEVSPPTQPPTEQDPLLAPVNRDIVESLKTHGAPTNRTKAWARHLTGSDADSVSKFLQAVNEGRIPILEPEESAAQQPESASPEPTAPSVEPKADEPRAPDIPSTVADLQEQPQTDVSDGQKVTDQELDEENGSPEAEDATTPPPPKEPTETTTAASPEGKEPHQTHELKPKTLKDLEGFFVDNTDKDGSIRRPAGKMDPAVKEAALALGHTNKELKGLVDERDDYKIYDEVRNALKEGSFVEKTKQPGIREKVGGALGRLRSKESIKETKSEPEGFGPRQIAALKKVADKYNAKEPLHLTPGEKGALRAFKKEFGLKGRLDSKRTIRELKQALKEDRIKERSEAEKTPPPKEYIPGKRVAEKLRSSRETIARATSKPREKIEQARSKGAESLRNQAEKTAVGRFLYRTAESFLNKFDWRDKEKGSWVLGMGFGAATTAVIPIPGLSSVVRAPILVGLNLAGTKGINILRLRAIQNALKPYISDLGQLKERATQFDNAFRFYRGGNKEEFNAQIQKLSNEIAQGKNLTEEAQNLAQKELIAKIEMLGEKYAKTQNHIRSFAAGISAGSIGSAIIDSALVAPLTGQHTYEWARTVGAKIYNEDRWNNLIPGRGGPEVIPGEAPPEVPTGVDFNEQLNPLTLPEGVQDDEAWKTFANTWNSLNPEQREGFLEVMSDEQRVAELVRWAEAAEAANQAQQASAEILTGANEVVSSPDLANSLEIARGDTVSDILANNGYQITWTNQDADVFGSHILANYDNLSDMHERVREAGLTTEFESFPTPEEVVNLIRAAEGGDAAAFQRLIAASHWIPEGGNYNVLTQEGFEALKRRFGLT